MTYNVDALRKMIDNNMSNIASFTDLLKMMDRWEDSEHKEYLYTAMLDRIAGIRNDVRILAAMVENGGERIPDTFFDVMQYSACMGADTSWWTKGT